MKTYLLLILILAAGTFAVSGQTDLTTRKALYFTGAKSDAIDLKNDVYVANGATLSLSAELRTSCDTNVCEFNVGVIATRTGTGSLSSVVNVQVEKNGETFSKAVNFGPSETSKQVIFPVKLRLGKNVLSVTIDPANATAESSESNNSFTGTVMVSWKRTNPGNKN